VTKDEPKKVLAENGFLKEMNLLIGAFCFLGRFPFLN
jgi:hypothetical protein